MKDFVNYFFRETNDNELFSGSKIYVQFSQLVEI